MENKPVIIFGSGAEARITLDIFNSIEVFPLGVVTNDPEQIGKDFNDVSVFGQASDGDVLRMLKDEGIDYIITWGEIAQRREVSLAVGKLAGRPPVNCLHGFSVVSPYVAMGFGNILNAGVVINANAKVGDGNIFNSHVSVDPDAVIGSFCTLSAGVRIGGNVEIADEVFIGTGAIIYPGVKVGKGALIGAGAVVLREVKAGEKVFGNPASTLD
ncbi:MAG: hypothetical protein H6581_17790 [Bacteroidia bacterium]|nr:hypothetical protein [Bacteroidia bacterium]